MEEKKKDIKFILVVGIILLVIVLIIFIPILSENKENQDTLKEEYNLIKEGKVKNSNEVINEIVEILKAKDKEKLEEYLLDDFIYYDNNNYEHKYLSSFFDDLKIYISSYEIEQRGNISSNEEATYRIYWNIVEANKKNGIQKGERNYCLQTITITLKKVVQENEITYQIEKIILQND